jgi:translation elongation factor EF-Ts
MASRLEKAPEHTHEAIVSGKLLSNFYSKVLLGCMPYLLSNEGAQVSQYWNSVEQQTGTNISVLRAVSWECK